MTTELQRSHFPEMGRRSKMPENAEDVGRMTLGELNGEIDRVARRLGAAPTTYLKKAFFKQLVFLESEREALHGVPAPDRSQPARGL